MADQHYFTASAANPVELAEKNLPFYQEFVAIRGCSSAYRYLWPGQNLAEFINSFDLYARQSGCISLVIRANQLKSKYETLYLQLTGHRYNIYSSKLNGIKSNL